MRQLILMNQQIESLQVFLLDLKSPMLREISACSQGLKAVLFRLEQFLLEALISDTFYQTYQFLEFQRKICIMLDNFNTPRFQQRNRYLYLVSGMVRGGCKHNWPPFLSCVKIFNPPLSTTSNLLTPTPFPDYCWNASNFICCYKFLLTRIVAHRKWN